jgi:cyclopropane fatty-acyl-phospholipid synthase-like methyltransferase
MYPQLQATIVDLATVTPITQRYVAEAGLTERVHVMSADVVHEPLRGAFDVAVLLRFIQVLSPDQARRVLRHVSQVVEPGGRLYIIGNVLDNSRLSPLQPMLSNLFYVNVFDEGQSYTEQEYRDWIADAGFEQCERLLLPNDTSLVRARKPR